MGRTGKPLILAFGADAVILPLDKVPRLCVWRKLPVNEAILLLNQLTSKGGVLLLNQHLA